MSDDPESASRHNTPILNSFAESLGEIQGRNLGRDDALPIPVKEFTIPGEDTTFTFLEFLKSTTVTDFAIKDVASVLPGVVENSPQIFEELRQFGEDEEPSVDPQRYVRFVGKICEEMKMDLQQNKGTKIRNIVRQTGILGVERAMGNENLRGMVEGYIERNSAQPDVNFQERIVLVGLVLHMAELEWQRGREIANRALNDLN